MAHYQMKKERKGKQKKNFKKKKQELINNLRNIIFSPTNFEDLIVGTASLIYNIEKENKKEVKKEDEKSDSNHL